MATTPESNLSLAARFLAFLVLCPVGLLLIYVGIGGGVPMVLGRSGQHLSVHTRILLAGLFTAVTIAGFLLIRWTIRVNRPERKTKRPPGPLPGPRPFAYQFYGYAGYILLLLAAVLVVSLAHHAANGTGSIEAAWRISTLATLAGLSSVIMLAQTRRYPPPFWEAEWNGHRIRIQTLLSKFKTGVYIDGVEYDDCERGLALSSVIRHKFHADGEPHELRVHVGPIDGWMRIGCHIFVDDELVGGDVTKKVAMPLAGKTLTFKGRKSEA